MRCVGAHNFNLIKQDVKFDKCFIQITLSPVYQKLGLFELLDNFLKLHLLQKEFILEKKIL